MKAELHELHVGTNDADSVHDEHSYGQPVHCVDQHSNRDVGPL